MMKRSLSLLLFLSIFISLLLLPCGAQASETNYVRSAVTITNGGEEISPRADVIVVKFRISGGVLQYRRWNETWGYWVDPYWKDVT